MNKKTYKMPEIQVVNIEMSAIMQNSIGVKGTTSGSGITFGNSSEYAGDDSNEDW